MSLFVSGALFAEIQVLLLVAGALFDEVLGSLFVAGALFAEVQVHFSWQAHYFVNFGIIAGARMGFFHTICLWRARKETSVARRVAD